MRLSSHSSWLAWSLDSTLVGRTQTSFLQLHHGNNVGGLDVVLELGDLLLEIIDGDLVVLNDEVDLELLDTETNGNQLGATPDQTLLLDAADGLLHGLQVGLVICVLG